MKKFNFVAFGALLAMMTGALVSCGDNKPTGPSSTNPPISTPEEITAKYTFTGKVTLQSVEHNATLKCFEDGTFTLAIDGVSSYEEKGTYVFTEKIGFTFTFSNKTEVSSTFDKENKDHVVVIEIKAGDAGSGTATLKLHDENFVLDESSAGKTEYVNNSAFTGSFKIGSGKEAVTYTANLKLKEDGTLDLEYESHENMKKTGTYTFEKNEFVLTIGGKEYKSVFDLGTAEYTIAYKETVEGTEYDLNLKWNPTKASLTGSNSDDFGGLDCALYLYSNHTALFDITCRQAPSPMFQTMFDKVATWNVKQGKYTFTLNAGTENEENIEAALDQETNKYAFNYIIHGERDVIIPMSGEKMEILALQDTQQAMGHKVPLMLGFMADNVVFRDTDCDLSFINFDAEGTYTFVDNVITTTLLRKAGDTEPQVCTSTWDEKTGTYTISGLTITGPETTLIYNPTLALW